MKRINFHNNLILREAFDNRKAFLTFDYSPNEVVMSTYYSIRGREIPFAIMLLLFLLQIPAIAQSPQIQSVFEKYLRQAKQDTFSLGARKRFLKIAYNSLKGTEGDSIKYYRISKIVEISSHFEDSLFFFDLASDGLKLAEELETSALIGDAHWNYGSYYLRTQKYDSSYYHYNRAYTFFMAGHREYYAGKMLYNMAYIASETNDLTGTEILLFRSIKIFERTNHLEQQYRCYNILGTNADDMEEFEKSLLYYQKAARLIPSIEDSQYYQLENWNNLGVRLYKMGLYEQAIALFDNALQYAEILTNYPTLNARLLDNRAYCFVCLGQYENVSEVMSYAQALRDSVGETAGSVTSRLRFANYYGKIGDTLQGIVAAKEALNMATSNYLTPHVLKALELLANLDKPNSLYYLEQHIAQNKRLNARDRKLRNKFTAIQYKTDEYIQENESLFRQRLWISIGALAITIIFLLIYRNTRHRAKNKELLFEREQQQYNEDLFLMTLKQKANLEKGKTEERQRISQELHDDIVSRLFTLRFRWLTVTLSGEAKMVSLHRQFLELLERLEADIRNLAYELKSVAFFEEEKFIGTLENILEEKREVGGFDTRFECQNPEDWENLNYLVKINLQRIFEEVLQNVLKHSQANKVSVFMVRELGYLHLSILDNGKGMDILTVKKGMGMKSLENRTEKLQGQFEIYSGPSSGTTIKVRIPFKLNIQ